MDGLRGKGSDFRAEIKNLKEEQKKGEDTVYGLITPSAALGIGAR